VNVNTEELVEAYIAIRNKRELLLRNYEEQDKALKADMTQLEAAMLNVCNQINADSIKTSHGTVMRKLNERFFCQDWDNFYQFVLVHEAPHLLERRIHQGNFKEFMKDHEGDGLPPGVNVMREYGVTVRKSS
jgi:predicted metal-dependent hydrolase